MLYLFSSGLSLGAFGGGDDDLFCLDRFGEELCLVSLVSYMYSTDGAAKAALILSPKVSGLEACFASAEARGAVALLVHWSLKQFHSYKTYFEQ